MQTKPFAILLVGLLTCVLSGGGAVWAHPAVDLIVSSHGRALALARTFTPHVSTHAAISAFLAKGTTALFSSQSLTRHTPLSFNPSLLGPGSLATKQAAATIKLVVANGIAAGENLGASRVQVSPLTPIGGNVVSGQLEGDLYVRLSGGAPIYINTGEFNGTVGSNIAATIPTSNSFALGTSSLNPAYQNNLTFPTQSATYTIVNSKGPSSGGVGPGILPSLATGSQRRFLFGLASLTAKSVGVGAQIGLTRALADVSRLPTFSGGAVAGGIFYGTAYRNSLFSSTYVSSPFTIFNGPPSYVFAFGNNPLNNPAARLQPVYLPTEGSSLSFANGLDLNITNGQILFPNVSFLNFLRNGSVLTFGSNPANNGLSNNVLSNLSSFIFF
jgi:hypothetical protein